MQKPGSKKGLAVILSGLKGFENPRIELEQYTTESEIAAEVLWNAFLVGEIQEKTAADLGCGTGILGIGALLLGASKVFFVDKDLKALETAKENLIRASEKYGKELAKKAVFLHRDVSLFDEKVDIVLENPPFGIKGERHADKAFLEKAMGISDTIYSFHKEESKRFISAVCRDKGFRVEGYWEFDWPLKKAYSFHSKKVEHIRVGCWRIKKDTKERKVFK